MRTVIIMVALVALWYERLEMVRLGGVSAQVINTVLGNKP